MKNSDYYSFSHDETMDYIELLELSGKKLTDADENRISLLQREIKFEKLLQARREYEISALPPGEWPPALKGRTTAEWEIVTKRLLNLPVPAHLKVTCKDFIDELDQKEGDSK